MVAQNLCIVSATDIKALSATDLLYSYMRIDVNIFCRTLKRQATRLLQSSKGSGELNKMTLSSRMRQVICSADQLTFCPVQLLFCSVATRHMAYCQSDSLTHIVDHECKNSCHYIYHPANRPLNVQAIIPPSTLAPFVTHVLAL